MFNPLYHYTEQLIQNTTVMGALTRVLQEEYKKSIELTFNILRIFLSFSNFVEMHELVSNYRIGLLTMKAIEFELQRIELRETEYTSMVATYTSQLKATKAKRDSISDDEYQFAMYRIKKQREKDEYFHHMFARKQDKLLFVCFFVLCK